MSIFDRIAKRDGLYVSRPVLNADSWVKWAEKFGVPNPVPAEKMHVTILASRKDVKTKPAQMTHQVFTGGGMCDTGYFSFMGPEADVLAYCWACDWLLQDRHYSLINMGCTSDWPEYRPHITLSYDAKGFELSDEALAAMPPSFLLGGEIHGPFAPPPKETLKKSDAETFVLEDAARVAAYDRVCKALLEGWGDLDVEQQQTIGLIAGGHPVLKASIDALEGKVAFADSPPTSGIFKTDEECRLVYGWASVSIAKGEQVKDSHRHKITTKALRQLCHGIMRGQRAGKFDHQGLKKTDIVEGMVFDADVWGAMGDYFERIGELTKAQADVFRGMKFEGFMAGFHCEDDGVWEMAKARDFELSIGAEEATLRELNEHG